MNDTLFSGIITVERHHKAEMLFFGKHICDTLLRLCAFSCWVPICPCTLCSLGSAGICNALNSNLTILGNFTPFSSNRMIWCITWSYPAFLTLCLSSLINTSVKSCFMSKLVARVLDPASWRAMPALLKSMTWSIKCCQQLLVLLGHVDFVCLGMLW